MRLSPSSRHARLVLFALLAIAASIGAAADIHVQVSSQGEGFEVRAVAEIAVDVADAWKVLTDYDRLSEFIPGMAESRVVSRDGPKVVVEQRGETSLLFLTFPMRVRLEVEERPYERIESNAIGGNFKSLHGVYLLEPKIPGMLLRYEGSFTPDFGFPPLLGTLIVRNTVERRFGAMVKEIERAKAGDSAPVAK